MFLKDLIIFFKCKVLLSSWDFLTITLEFNVLFRVSLGIEGDAIIFSGLALSVGRGEVAGGSQGHPCSPLGDVRGLCSKSHELRSQQYRYQTSLWRDLPV